MELMHQPSFKMDKDIMLFFYVIHTFRNILVHIVRIVTTRSISHCYHSYCRSTSATINKILKSKYGMEEEETKLQNSDKDEDSEEDDEEGEGEKEEKLEVEPEEQTTLQKAKFYVSLCSGWCDFISTVSGRKLSQSRSTTARN